MTKPWVNRLIVSFIGLACLCFISSLIVKKFMPQHMLATLIKDVHKEKNFIDTYLDTHEEILKKTALHNHTVQLIEQVSKEPTEQTKHYEAYLSSSLPLKNYKNIFIITNNGDVVFTLKESYFSGNNLIQMPYREQPLGRLFKRSTVTRSVSLLCVPSVTNFDKQSIFISAPIIKNTAFLGSFIAELDPSELFTHILQNRSKGTHERVFVAQSEHNLIELMLLYPEQAALFAAIRPYHQCLLNATHGDFGAKIAIGLNREKTFIAWGYEADLHVGILATLPYSYVTFYITLLWAISLLLLFIGLGLFFTYTSWASCLATATAWYHKIPYLYSSLRAYGLYLLCGLSIGGFFILLALYNHTTRQDVNTALAQTNTEMRFLAQQINSILFNMQQIGNRLSRELSKRKYQNEELEAFVKTLLEGNPNIWGIGIASQPESSSNPIDDSNNTLEKTYNPYWVHAKHGIEKLTFGKLTNNNVINQDQLTNAWYTQALNQGSCWQDPYIDPVTQKKIVSYSSAFYHPNDTLKQQPLGVIVITYRTSMLHTFIKNLGFKTSQHSIINSNTGLMIYHPNVEFVLQRKTIFDLVYHSTQDFTQATHQHLKEITPGFKWFHDEAIPQTKWTFSSSFTEQDIKYATQHISMLLMFLVFFAFLALFSIISLLIKHHLFETTHKHAILITYSLLVSMSTIALWGIIYNEQWQHPAEETIITDNVKLHKKIDALNQAAMSHLAQKPIPISTGIAIDQIDDSNPKETIIAATIWQTYDKEQLKTITPGFAVSRTKKLFVKKFFEKEKDNKIVIGWKMRCHLFQKTDYSRYPFEKKKITLVIEHTDGKHNAVCVPDFNHYQISPNNLYPWLSKNVDLIKKLEDSFFSYDKKESSLAIAHVNKELKLHIIAKEDVLNPLISYIIPLIVILFSIFALLWLPPASRIPGFTGIFFATIILHRALRDILKIGGLIYLEYLFFLIYFTLLCTTAITILTFKEEASSNNIYEKLKLYFWPTQVSLWLAVAVWIFYH